MEGIAGFAGRWFTKLKWVLVSKKWEYILNRQFKELCTHVKSVDQILVQEYEDLIKAFEMEDDPIRRYRIMTGIMEIEKVLEQRRAIMDHLRS